MKLYDALISECKELLRQFDVKYFERAPQEELWETESEQKIIFKRDAEYELGGGLLPAASGLAFTSDPSAKDGIWLCGRDLRSIRQDSPYARLTIINVDDEGWSDNNTAYSAMRRIDYTRYHVYPKGFMMRISPSECREPVRVERKALEEGLDFAKVGSLFINAYHQHAEVRGVQVIFITEEAFPYEELNRRIRKMESVTRSLDSIFNNLVMDCSVCSLKPVCDEVEGMRELHFARSEVGVDNQKR